MLPIGKLVCDRVKEIINDVDFDSLEIELKKIKEESQNMEHVILQQAWLMNDTGMEYEEFNKLLAVN